MARWSASTSGTGRHAPWISSGTACAALLGRSETRDLVDVEALLAAGGDLDRAMADAPRKDGGFSPATLAWVLQNVRMTGWERHVPFRDWLIDRLLA